MGFGATTLQFYVPFDTNERITFQLSLFTVNNSLQVQQRRFTTIGTKKTILPQTEIALQNIPNIVTNGVDLFQHLLATTGPSFRKRFQSRNAFLNSDIAKNN